MICYLDMTFCIADCQRNCRFKLTQEIEDQAKQWWDGMRGDPPIAVADRSDGCNDYLPNYNSQIEGD